MDEFFGFLVTMMSFGFILRIVRMKLEFNTKANQKSLDPNDDDITALRKEVAAVGDTSTQFAMSIEHTLQRLEQRLDSLERRTMLSSASGETTGAVSATASVAAGSDLVTVDDVPLQALFPTTTDGSNTWDQRIQRNGLR